MLINRGVLTSFGNTPENIWEIGIYRDQSLVLDTPAHINQIETNFPNLTMYSSGLRIDNSTAVPIGVVGRHPWDSVATDVDMGQLAAGHGWLQPSFGYPLDKWSGSITFVGQFHVASRLSNMSTSFGTFIDGAYLVDSIRQSHLLQITHILMLHSQLAH